MELVAIVISVLALGLSGFTFYWTSIREVKKLYLVRIDRIAAMMNPEFALVNGGLKDILITSIECGFDDKDKNGISYPSHSIQINEGDSLLLSAGKAFHCKVKFNEPFTTSFALAGEKCGSSVPVIYERDMRIDVSWVEQRGVAYKTSVVISKYGFAADGQMRKRSPKEYVQDLYYSATSLNC